MNPYMAEHIRQGLGPHQRVAHPVHGHIGPQPVAGQFAHGVMPAAPMGMPGVPTVPSAPAPLNPSPLQPGGQPQGNLPMGRLMMPVGPALPVRR